MRNNSYLKPLVIAAYIAHPYIDMPNEMYQCAIKEVKNNADNIYAFLVNNKVLFRVLSFLWSSENHLLKKNLIKMLIKNYQPFRKSYESAFHLKRQLLQVVKEFKSNGLESFFIKSFNSLPLDSENFDILIKEQDLVKAHRILTDLGFVEIVWAREPYKQLFRKVRAESLAIHLHTQIAWEGIKFVDANDLWANCREVKIEDLKVYMPSKEHHMLITLAHAFFEDHNFKLRDLMYLVEDIESRDGVDWNYVIRWTVFDCWFKPFSALLLLANHTNRTFFMKELITGETVKKYESGLAQKLINEFDKKPCFPVEISTITVALQYINKILMSSKVSSPQKMRRVFSLFYRFIKKRNPLIEKHPALIICFSGPDGTGKTTHAKYLWKSLEKKNVKVNYVWTRGIGSFFEPLLHVVRRLISGKFSEIYGDEYASRRESLLKRGPIKILWAYITLTDHLLQLLLKVRIPLLLGYVVICDRYFHDTLIDIRCELGKNINKFLEEMFEGLIPKPEITFIMDANPEDIMNRKSEMKFQTVRWKRSAYLKYLHKKKIALINTSECLERNKEKILTIALKAYYSDQK